LIYSRSLLPLEIYQNLSLFLTVIPAVFIVC